MQVIAQRYDNSGFLRFDIEDDRVQFSPHDSSIDNDAKVVVAPGLVDLQVNGINGIDFSNHDCDSNQAELAALKLAAVGVTRFLPTVTTNSIDALRESMQRLSAAFESSSLFSKMAGGIHLEGPYIATEDGPRGAHPRRFCKAPDWDEFQSLQGASGDRIKLITLSPEYDEAPGFIEKATTANIRVAIGHTSANSQQVAAAVSAGATLSTHLGNGAHGTICRHPNYIWDQLADDRLTATLITDGHHLPQSVVKSFVRCKGIDNAILVSDMTSLSGMPPGVYSNTVLGDVEVLEGGKLVVAGQRQYLAGASMPLIECIGTASEFAEIDLKDAIDMATKNATHAMNWGERPSDMILYRINTNAPAAKRFELLATVCDNKATFNTSMN